MIVMIWLLTLTEMNHSVQCRQRTLNQEKRKLRKSMIPPHALFLGNYQGGIPAVLHDLNMTEQSMISIYNAVTKLSLQFDVKNQRKRGRRIHWHGKPTTYFIINDLASIAEQLPRMPCFQTTCILRHKKDATHTDYQFRPKKVVEALYWLKTNNFLYKDIDLKWTPDIDWESHGFHNIPFIELSDDDVNSLDMAQNDTTDDTPASNPGTVICHVIVFIADSISTGSRGQETEMLLVPPEGYVHNAELLKEIIHQRATNVYERSNRHQFVDPHRVPEYFWEKCFPILFPYGRGGPSDPSLITLKFKDFVASVLQRGGCSQGRRFQSCAPFVFAAYTIEMRRKMAVLHREHLNANHNVKKIARKQEM